MNREDIIRMATEAGIIHPEMVYQTLERFAELVASAEREKYEAIITNMTKLLEAQQNREGVAVDMIAAGIAAEREACAKVCENQADDGTEGEWDGCCLTLAKQIRARGRE